MALNIDISKTVSLDAGPAIKAGTRQWMEDGAAAGFAKSQEEVPEDRGTLRQSGFQPEWTAGGTLRWGYSAGHADDMEFGTRPFWPELEPLLDWAERVVGDRSFGYYVAREKIPSEGIDAQPYIRPGRDKQVQWYNARDVRSYIDERLQ